MERLVCSQREGDLLKISGSEFRHLKALRLRKGEQLEVYCENKLYLAVISHIGKDYVLCHTIEELDLPLPKPQVVLYQCLPVELGLMEEVIDRVSQAGAFKLVPVICKRGFQGRSKIEEKMERWHRISLASFKQCKRPKPMEIDNPVKLTDLYPKEEVSLVLDNFGGSLSIKEIDLNKESYGIVVGPEGGFSQEEVELLKSRGFLTLLLRCASIAAIEFGGVNPFLFYTLFTLFALFLSLYQFYLPIKLWQTLFKRFLWALPFLYVFFELLRSYFPYGGFPWLILGSLSVYMPIIKDSLLYTNLYIHSLFLLLTSLFLLQKRFKALFFLWIVFFVMGLLAIKEKEDKLREAKTVRVALVQTAVPQKDKLNREAFRRHSEDITGLVEKAIKDRPQLVILPESALYFFFSEEEDDYNIRLKDLSIKVPILVGLIDIREGMRPYNSAYLLAEGRAVDYYDKVRLFPIGEYMPQPFGFLKEFFPAIGGIDYVSGDRIRPLEYKGISVATPICFEVAYFDLVKSLSKKANFIAVLTNDGWFKNSDCTHQHYLWGRIRALETGKYVLWVNNSSDTGFIDPYGRPIKRMSYMEKGVVVYEVKAVQ